MSDINFCNLAIYKLANELIANQHPVKPITRIVSPISNTGLSVLHPTALAKLKQRWQHITTQWQQLKLSQSSCSQDAIQSIEQSEVNWLMALFNHLFAAHNVILVRSESEPEYFPATDTHPARIEFAHGFFQSALHEISHWCIAGKHRRSLPDFGYWYKPDGRTEAQQIAFETVEIKPQAIECLLTRMCAKPFRVSQDNLQADFDTSQSTFAVDVYNQAQTYIQQPHTLPTDALTLLTALAYICRDIIDIDRL